jgi:transcriptional regulator with XRE-family HTH domain
MVSRASIHKTIQRLRVRRGLSQRELAQRAKVTPGYIAQLEMGLRKNPSDDVLRRIAEALNVHVSELRGVKEMTFVVTVKLKDGKELKFRDVSGTNSTDWKLVIYGPVGHGAVAEFDKADVSSWYSEDQE